MLRPSTEFNKNFNSFHFECFPSHTTQEKVSLTLVLKTINFACNEPNSMISIDLSRARSCYALNGLERVDFELLILSSQAHTHRVINTHTHTLKKVNHLQFCSVSIEDHPLEGVQQGFFGTRDLPHFETGYREIVF